MFQPTITNQEIELLPRKEFPGRIIVVDNSEAMKEAEEVLAKATVLGYDTETRPAFRKGVKHKMALLQLTTDNTALLFRLLRIELSPAVIDALQNPDIKKVGAAIRDDIKGMQKRAKFKPEGFIDLQSIVEEWGIGEKSVKKMAAIVLGIKVSKAQRLSNWEANKLTPAQQDYAAMDAWTCGQIYTKLMNTPKPRPQSQHNPQPKLPNNPQSKS